MLGVAEDIGPYRLRRNPRFGANKRAVEDVSPYMFLRTKCIMYAFIL